MIFAYAPLSVVPIRAARRIAGQPSATGEDGPNPYGPNPRFDRPGDAA